MWGQHGAWNRRPVPCWNCIGKTLNLFEVNVRETEECTIQRNCMTRFGKKKNKTRRRQTKQNYNTCAGKQDENKQNKKHSTICVGHYYIKQTQIT